MKKKILIVDDEANIRELLGEFLEEHGYAVMPVSSAHEAEDWAAAGRPDLIISDLQLEDSDGLEMIARLKSILPEAPVLLLTGVLFDPQVVRETLADKISAYLQKTSPLGRVLEEVVKLIGPAS